ncbi:MAG: hypothetical protein S4CHLAM7_07240 [Chlamydiae bacterium]|nr:hypothetical protein [Chlamydiota bacterium]
MKFRFSYLLIFISLFSFKFSLNAQPFICSREADPGSIIKNVSVIHGDYSDLELDLSIEGSDSLLLSRFYTSQKLIIPADFGGWFLRPQKIFRVDQENGESYTTHEGKFELTHIYVGTDRGSILKFTGWKNVTNPQNTSTFYIDPEEEFLGIANTAHGKASSWTNIKNYKLCFDPEKNTYELFFSDGRKNLFVYDEISQNYQLKIEELATGNKVHSEYDEQDQLVKLTMTTEDENQIISWITLDYGSTIKANSSSGDWVEYHFAVNSGEHSLLTQVINPQRIDIEYEYQIEDQCFLLTKRKLSESNYFSINYEDGADHRVNRVSYPYRSGEEASTSFEYHLNLDESGYTEVTNPLGVKSCYFFDQDYQLTAIDYFLEGSLYRKERKRWGSKKRVGDLVAESIEDASGKIFYYKMYNYDTEHRLIEEKEYGNFTGYSPEPITFSRQDVPSGECHITKYEYSSDNGIDMVVQGDGNGSGIKFGYKKGTEILLFKFILERSQIRKRTFYDYDHGVLTALIVDDGDHTEKDRLYSLRERCITRTIPKGELPNRGAPEIIEEFSWDQNTRKEVLLKKIINKFNSKGQIFSQEIYGSNGELCYTLAMDYDAKGLLISETDPIGNITIYTYDKYGQLISEQKNLKKLIYTYDIQGNLVAQAMENSLGSSFETRFEYDALGSKIAEIDYVGRCTSFSYDDLGRLKSIIYPKQLINEHELLSPMYSYEYDLFDHQIVITYPDGKKTKSTFNVRGKPTKIEHLDGKEELYEYSVSGSLIRSQDTAGYSKKYDYDYLGRVESIEHFFPGKSYSYRTDYYRYGAFHLKSKRDSTGIATFEYDIFGRLIEITKETERSDSSWCSGNITNILYDSLSRVVGTKKWKNETEFSNYRQELDLLDRVIKETVENEQGKILSQIEYEYNSLNQLDQVIGYPNNQRSVLASYEYDELGRLIQVQDALGFAKQVEYDDCYIDSKGQKVLLKRTTDAKGHQIEEVFDSSGNLVFFSQKDFSGDLLFEERYFYDLSGQKVLERAEGFSPIKGKVEYSNAFSFLAGGELEQVMIGPSMEEPFIQESYDFFGKITQKMIPGFEKPICYSYDSDERIESIIYQSHLGEEKKYTHRWDSSNNLTKIKIGQRQKIDFTFSSDNSLLKETYHDPYGGYSLSLDYDGEGNITKVSLPDQSHIQYEYDGPFVQKIARLSSENQEQYTHLIIERDLAGAAICEALAGNAGMQKTSYDSLGRKILIETGFFTDEVLRYDENGNVSNRQVESNLQNVAYLYEYDGADQLISEEGLEKNQYEYDALGNRIAHNGFECSVSLLNQTTIAPESNYAYDDAGHLKSKSDAKGTSSFHFDQLGRLVEVHNENNLKIKFTYDPLGRRLTKVIEDEEIEIAVYRYFYVGFYELGCVDEAGNIIQLRIPDNPNHLEKSSIVAIEIAEQASVAISDINGNVSCLIDPQRRKVIERYLYTAFGEEEIYNKRGKSVSQKDCSNPWRFQSQYHDQETGLVYFGKRYYDPEIGKWVSPDPALSVDGLNLYTYVHNNPLRYKDFLGLYSDGCGCVNHGHPGYHMRPDGCICICGMNGSSLKSSFCGIAHGIVDIGCDLMKDLDAIAFYSELYTVRLLSDSDEKRARIQAFERSQQQRYSKVESWVQDVLGINPNDLTYASYRHSSRTGIEMGLVVAGGYGLVRSALGSGRIIEMSMKAPKIVRKNPHISNNPLKGTKYTTKVQRQMRLNAKTALPDNHSFPKIVDNYASLSKRQIILGHDNIERTHLLLKGSYKGKEGYFEWIIEANKQVNHRLFKPYN